MKNGEHLVILTESASATSAIDLEDRNYPDSLCCSLYGVQVIFSGLGLSHSRESEAFVLY